MMRRGRIQNYEFGRTSLAGVPVMWRGHKVSTGPLDFGLDDSTGISCGVMDYELGVVPSEFHLLVRFHRFALKLKALGIDAELIAPVHAVLKTEGEILPDDSFNGGLRGSCKVRISHVARVEDHSETPPTMATRARGGTNESPLSVQSNNRVTFPLWRAAYRLLRSFKPD